MSEPVQIFSKSPSELEAAGVWGWPIWEHGVAEFPWHYDSTEHCLLLAGRVTVTLDDGSRFELGAGDYCVFAAGLDCHWQIHEAVRKHYRFD